MKKRMTWHVTAFFLKVCVVYVPYILYGVDKTSGNSGKSTVLCASYPTFQEKMTAFDNNYTFLFP